MSKLKANTWSDAARKAAAEKRKQRAKSKHGGQVEHGFETRRRQAIMQKKRLRGMSEDQLHAGYENKSLGEKARQSHMNEVFRRGRVKGSYKKHNSSSGAMSDASIRAAQSKIAEGRRSRSEARMKNIDDEVKRLGGGSLSNEPISPVATKEQLARARRRA